MASNHTEACAAMRPGCDDEGVCDCGYLYSVMREGYQKDYSTPTGSPSTPPPAERCPHGVLDALDCYACTPKSAESAASEDDIAADLLEARSKQGWPAKAPQLSQAECERLYAETLVELADLIAPAAEVSRVEQIRAAYKDTYSFANGAASPSDTAYMLQQYDAARAELRRYEHRFGSTYAHQLEKEIAALKAEIVEYVEITNERNQLRRELESAQEGERFYRREWESACERYNYAQEERDEARAECERLKADAKHNEAAWNRTMDENERLRAACKRNPSSGSCIEALAKEGT